MASGDLVVMVLEVIPPGANPATPDVRTGGSTPAESFSVWDFDAGTQEYLDFKCLLLGYGGGGLTFTLPWSATSATADAVVWGIGIRRLADDAEDIDTAQVYDFNTATDTAANVSGEASYPTITFTNGADMDSWAVGEIAIVRVTRVAADGADTMTGDAELWGLWGKET